MTASERALWKRVWAADFGDFALRRALDKASLSFANGLFHAEQGAQVRLAYALAAIGDLPGRAEGGKVGR